MKKSNDVPKSETVSHTQKNRNIKISQALHTSSGEFSNEVIFVQTAQRATALLAREGQQPLRRAGVRVHLE